MNSVRGSCKDGKDGAGDLPSSHRLAVISGSVMSAALYPYCSDFIAAPRPARRRSPIRRHRNETFAVRLGTRVPRSGVGAGFVQCASAYGDAGNGGVASTTTIIAPGHVRLLLYC